MGTGLLRPDDAAMTAPTTAAGTPAARPARRLVLVPATAARPGRPDAALRRYRLARVSVEGREAARAERHAHLKRCYD